jgi:glutathione synthase/RimK-type ligase-like ATP-grasp enzyme
MALDVALATFVELPHGDEDDHLLASALTELGLSTGFVCWDDPDARWASAGVVIIRSPWDYHLRLNAFLGWVDFVGSATRLCNPPSIVRWNSHKRYLVELDERGVPIVPTTLVHAGEHAALGPGEHVVKPAVSIGADRTIRHATQQDLDALTATDDVLVQPYVTEVETEGELSIVCIEGTPTHVVRKVPASGDFRTQEHHGAVIDAVPLEASHVALADAALAAVDGSTLYARVDAVPVDGQLRVMELELIEPTLWLRWHPGAAELLAGAVVRILDDDRRG